MARRSGVVALAYEPEVMDRASRLFRLAERPLSPRRGEMRAVQVATPAGAGVAVSHVRVAVTGRTGQKVTLQLSM